ncbi:hypothetical protein MASR2M70_03630 [Bacillota bacterium]
MNAKKNTVIIDQPGEIDAEARSVIESFAELRIPETYDQNELIALLKDCDAVISWGNTKFTQELINMIPDRVKTLAITGTGTDNIDIEAANSKGITVTNTPGANANAVAEFTVGVVINVFRNIIPAVRLVSDKKWSSAEAFNGKEISNSSALIIGLGNIGQKVSRTLSAMGMKIYGYDPYVTKENALKNNITLIDNIEEASAAVDVICVHVPLSKETKGLLSYNCFNNMKSDAWVINVGRAPVVDEDAICDVLLKGKLGGYFTDVFPTEPPDYSKELYSLPNVFATPHIAAMTDVAYRNMQVYAAQNVKAVLYGEKPMNVIK